MSRLCLAPAVFAAALLAACSSSPSSPTQNPAPQSWTITNGAVTVTAEARFGASVTSVRDAQGHEYDDVADHGREWQIAYQLDGLDEAKNPTEAGSAADAAGLTSTSIILSASTPAANVFTSTVRPAFWYPYQGQLVSPDTVSKTVTIGYAGLPNVIRWDTSITIAESQSMGVFEPMAGTSPFLPLLYTRQADGTWALTAQEDKGTVTPAGSFIATSSDGQQALGILGVQKPYLTWNQLDAGGANIDGWGCGWITTPLPAGTYTETCYVAIGTLAEVEASLEALEGR